MSQEGKVVFITGGQGELGLVFAESFLKQGAKVALIDIRDGKEAEELKKKYGDEKVIALKCDITDNSQLRASYQKVVDIFGGLDIVINSAGLIDEVNFERTIAVNVTSLIASSYMAIDRMRKDRGGRGGILINIASLAGLIPVPYLNTYCATKAAVISFSKTLVKNLQDATGVKVGTICPAGIDTEIIRQCPDPKWREKDITEPHAQENLSAYFSFVNSTELMTTRRMAEILMKYLVEPNLHGSTISVSFRTVKYIYPEEIKGKKIYVDPKAPSAML